MAESRDAESGKCLPGRAGDVVLLDVDSHQLINQTSGDTEYYTPEFITDGSREVMGSIDLDPATSKTANHFVKAENIFTAKDDGLAQPWFGNIWMNHPFHSGWKACKPDCQRVSCLKINKKTGQARGHIYHDIPSNLDWVKKFIREYTEGRVEQACCITYACTSETWFKQLLFHPQCFLQPRTNYYLPDGTLKAGVTKGSVVTYLGDNLDAFVSVFSKYGVVKVAAPLVKVHESKTADSRTGRTGGRLVA